MTQLRKMVLACIIVLSAVVQDNNLAQLIARRTLSLRLAAS